MSNMTIDLEIENCAIFPQAIPIEVILGNHLNYGVYRSNHLTPGQLAENGFIAFDPKMITRGIRVYWRANEKRKISLHLSLPTADEEINELFEMVNRICNAWVNHSVRTGTFVLDQNAFSLFIEKNQSVNLKILHEIGLTVLDGSKGLMVLGCAKHRLVIGRKEAENFWSGTNTDKFRDWMNDRQQIDAIPLEPVIYESKEFKGPRVGEYTCCSGLNMIIPLHPILPNKFIDYRTGMPLLEVSEYRVCLTNSDMTKPFGYLTFNEFMRELPVECSEYYDADDLLVSGLTADKIIGMIEHARQIAAEMQNSDHSADID
ncbi:MAG: DUF4299 family protein [Erysipelotrichia bacterium]|nr:DUF4299 family protein [Erysipelotrichia bacterium]